MILLTCLTQLYVAPLQSALAHERHSLVEVLLSEPGGGSTENYQSKWHGDYVSSPRVSVGTVHALAQYFHHVVRVLGTQSQHNVSVEALFSARPVLAPRERNAGSTLGGRAIRWRAAVDASANDEDSSISDGLKVFSLFSQCGDESVIAFLTAAAESVPVSCGMSLSESDICTTSKGIKFACSPCAPAGWAEGFNSSTRGSTQRAWAGLRLMQLLSSLTVVSSWENSASTWRGQQNAVDSDRSLSRTWSATVTFSSSPGVGALTVVDAVVDVATRRDGFASSDNELSPYDGVAVVCLLVLLSLLTVGHSALRLRAVWLIARPQPDSPQRRGGDSADSEGSDNEGGELIPAAAPSFASIQNAEEALSEDPATSTSPVSSSEGTPSEWTLFLLRSKGRHWHFTAMLADGTVVAFCALSFAERGGLTMTPRLWTALQVTMSASVFMHCFGLVGFLRFTPRAYILIRATQRATGRLLLMLIGVLPCFIGFALLFFVAFGDRSAGEFETFGSTCVALGFMLFGDNLLPAFRLIDGSREWWMRAASDAAGCLYVAVFMGIVLNMSIATVVDTYKHVSREAQIVLLGEDESSEGDAGSEGNRLMREALIDALKEEVTAQLRMIKQLQERN